MTNTLAHLSFNRGALHPRLHVDRRLLIAGGLVLAVVVANVTLILLGALTFEPMTTVYTIT